MAMHNELWIRKAGPDDLERIMEIYAHARNFMAEHGNPRQWGNRNWPPQSLIEKDIQAEKSYVCVSEERIVGVFFYDYGYKVEAGYDRIDEGAWKGEDTYGVVHRIASDHSVKGIGRCCLNWAFEQCGHIRIDTHGDNKVMQNFLKGLGFEYCGIIYVAEDNDPRLAYEKM